MSALSDRPTLPGPPEQSRMADAHPGFAEFHQRNLACPSGPVPLSPGKAGNRQFDQEFPALVVCVVSIAVPRPGLQEAALFGVRMNRASNEGVRRKRPS